jgi:signal transduction histidine kinase
VSIGLPGHLAPHSESRAFARASHVIALVCLAAVMLIAVFAQERHPGELLWPIAAAVVPMALVLWLLERHPGPLFSVAYLVVGAACVYGIVLVGTQQPGHLASTDAFVYSTAKLALMFAGGAGLGVVRLMGWCALGFVVGETVTLLAAAQTGAEIVPDLTTLFVLVVVVTMLTTVALSRRRVADAQPSLHRAARDEHLSDIRHRVELRAAAMMHDTILNHLAAVGSAPDGPLRADLRDRIERDLEVLVGQEWLVEADDASSSDDGADWLDSRFSRTIDESRELGLSVVVSGDRAALARLEPAREGALALAVKQCLVNVLKHAGTDHAEVVVYGSGAEVSVMVIDGGRGFTERDTATDRLGLRHSVRRRIEAVGGSVQVWSTPGTGTSVLIRLPAGPADATVEAVG